MRREVLLWLGVGLGIAGALVGVTEETPTGLDDPDVVALVGSTPITAERYFRVLAELSRARDTHTPNSETRRRVADELVAEELLLSRAIDLGLAHTDPMARQHLLLAMMSFVEANDRVETDESALRRYYEAHPDQFQGASQVRLSAMYFGGRDAEARASAARREVLGGVAFDEVRKARGDEPVLAVPDRLLSTSTLRQYLGPTAAVAVERLAQGELSMPLVTGGGCHLVRVEERVAPARLTFEEARAAATTLVRREELIRARREYVDGLRRRSVINFNDALLSDDAPIPERFRREARAPSAEEPR